MKERVVNLIKPILFIALGILLLIFNTLSFTYLHATIGGVLILFGLFDVIDTLISGEIKEKLGTICYGGVEVLLGIILLTKFGELVTNVAIIWAIWSILREAREIGEVINEYKSKVVLVISALESAVVIVLSIILLLHPTDEHIIEHLYILGAELILAILFPFLDNLLGKNKNKGKKEKQK